MCTAECQDSWHRWNSQVPKREPRRSFVRRGAVPRHWVPQVFQVRVHFQAEGNHLIEHLALNYHRHWDRVVVTITNWRYIIFQQSLKLTSQKIEKKNEQVGIEDIVVEVEFDGLQ